MNISINQRNDSKVAIIESDGIVISDLQSTMDLLADISFHYECQKMLINKENICPEFFTNYRMKIAIVGNFSIASKSLADFIRECNRGKQVFFTATQQEALEMLHKYEA